MQRTHSYPPELARCVEDNWPQGRVLPVSSTLFCEALSIAFQASLTSEESRPTRFRLLLTPADVLPEDGAPNEGVLRLRFDQSRPFHADELRRLSPSTPFETALIGVHAEDDKLRIWGIAHSGPAWLAPTWGGRSPVPNWTYDPIIHVVGPGRLAVRCAGTLIGALQAGMIVNATIDVFESDWLPALFTRERQEAVEQHAARQARSQSPTLAEHALVSRVGQHMLRRAIQLTRAAGHGGIILVVDDPGLVDGLRLKYRFQQDAPAKRYRALLLEILDGLAATTTESVVGLNEFAADSSPHVARVEQSIFELSRLIANLTSIDGAVVLDKRFGLIGFGAEVSAELPAPSGVYRALDSAGSERELDDIESVGTRHRAAYRFVNDHPRSLALVVSQDGDVRFVAKQDGEVVFWQQSVSP
jgi:DisA bacterial checkpoint controller nucleotide-binding